MSGQARWSRRIAMFSAQLFVLGILLHRFGSLSTPSAIYIFGVAILMAVTALLISCIAMAGIWRHGTKGTGYAVTGIFVSALVLSGPLWYVPSLFAQPKINDIATDTIRPPQFRVLSALRPAGSNPSAYPGANFAARQQRSYPDIGPMIVERSSMEVFNLVSDAVKRLNWDIVSEVKPEGENPGHIEAVSHTLIMGFKDDVAIRVSAGKDESRIDVRSASRYGEHDFGANAKRVTALFAEIKTELEKGERTALELALARRAKQRRDIKRKAQKKIRLAREKSDREEQERLRRVREEELKRQEAQLRVLTAEEQRIQSQLQRGLQPGLLPFPGAVQGVPKQRVRRRGGRWNLPADRFFQRFAE